MSDYFKHIDDYNKGLLAGVKLEAFEKEMQINPELRSAVEKDKLVRKISMGFLEEEVKQVLIEKKETETNVTHTKIFRRRIIGIAAAVLLLGFSYFLLSDKLFPGPPQYSELHKDPNWPTSDRGGQESALGKAILLGLNGQINEAVLAIKNTNETKNTKNYWIAELFAREIMPDSVLHYLPSQAVDKKQRDRIEFLRILSYYELGRKDELKKAIDNVAPDTDEWYLKKYKKIR